MYFLLLCDNVLAAVFPWSKYYLRPVSHSLSFNIYDKKEGPTGSLNGRALGCCQAGVCVCVCACVMLLLGRSVCVLCCC